MQATNRRLKCFKTFAHLVEETSTVFAQVHFISTERAHYFSQCFPNGHQHADDHDVPT